MKKVMIAVYTLFFAYSVVAAQNRSINNLVGIWEAVDETDQKGGLEVLDSTKIFLVYDSTKLPVIAYQADFTKSPAWFDFTVKDGAKEIQLKSLLQFVNEDTVQWQVFDDDTRPVIFAAGRGDMLYMKRKKGVQ